LQYRILVIVLAAVMMVAGVTRLRDTSVDVYPEFDPPFAEVQTEALGLSAAEIESLITVPMEADLLNGVAWLDQIYSESVAGLSSILLVFEPGTDPIRARQMVQERLAQSWAMPNVSMPPALLNPVSTTNRVMAVGLSSQKLSLIEMGVLARWNIKPRLMGVPGVANVAIWGQRERQLQVLVDPERLRDHDVSLRQIIETTGDALWVSPLSYLESSTPGTAGWIDTPNQRLAIHHYLPISSADDLAKVTVVDTGRQLLLGDVAKVVEDHQPLIGDAVVRDTPNLMLVVEKSPWASTLEVTRGVEETLEVMRPGLAGVEMDTIFRPANYIEAAVGNLGVAFLIGGLLVVLMALLYGWRGALITLVAISASLTAALFVLHLAHVPLNMLVLAGLVMALGVVIDDAIVDMDNVVRRLRQHRQAGGDQSAASIILEASAEMRSGLLFATLIILLAVLPVLLMPGLSGSFFRPLALSYALAVLASLAVSLIVTPALALSLVANGASERGESPLLRWLRHGYEAVLPAVVRSPHLAYLVVGVTAVAGLATLPLLDRSVLPPFKETELRIEWEGAPGTSRAEMNRIMTRASRELRSIPGVSHVGSQVGRAITGDDVVGINSGELWVSLDRAVDYDATLASIREVVAGYPGLDVDVETYQPERIGEALAAKDQGIVVRIYGHDLQVLHDKALEVSKAISGIAGVVEARADLEPDEAQVEIEVDLRKAERHQIKPGDVRRQAATLLSGLRVGNLYEGQKIFDVVVWGVPELRTNLTTIRELRIETPRGQVPLGELAAVRVAPSPVIIKRDAVSRFIDVDTDVRGRNLGSVAADIKARLKNVAFPLEYRAEVLTENGGRQAAPQRTLGVLVAVLVGTFLLLQAAFGSWRLTFAAVSTVPMVLSGGVVAALLGGGVLSLASLFGLLTVVGIAVRNLLLTTGHLQHLEQHGGEPHGPGLVLRGAGDRLAPILTTAATTALAFLPAAFFGDIAGLEIVHPMAVVILGGLVTSTVFNLFVVPVLYLKFGSIPETAALGLDLDAPLHTSPAGAAR
jgi:Cu/Ag efflux pump CusA